MGPLRAVHGVSSVALNLTEAATCRISLPRSERVPGPDEKGKGTAEEKRPGGFGTRVRLLSWAGHLADGIHAHARSLKGKGAVRLRKEPEGQRSAQGRSDGVSMRGCAEFGASAGRAVL